MPKTKKVYSKPGQKYDTPSKTDALYKFYTSLHKQRKDSKMAIKWCIEHGVFTKSKVEKLLLAEQFADMKI